MESNNLIEMWDVQKHRELNTLHRFSGYPCAVDFSKDGKYSVSVKGNNIKVRNLQEGRKEFNLVGHLYWVRDVKFSADGKFIVSGSDDMT